MRALLFGVQSWDVATLAGVAIVLAISAMSPDVTCLQEEQPA